MDPRAARSVELRFFGGRNEEIAECWASRSPPSSATAVLARAWLHRELLGTDAVADAQEESLACGTQVALAATGVPAACKILVVDDSDDIRELLRLTMELASGFRGARSGGRRLGGGRRWERSNLIWSCSTS